MKILFFRGIEMISLNNINKFYSSGTQKFHALKMLILFSPKKEWSLLSEKVVVVNPHF